jgi:hypothetical protein
MRVGGQMDGRDEIKTEMKPRRSGCKARDEVGAKRETEWMQSARRSGCKAQDEVDAKRETKWDEQNEVNEAMRLMRLSS